MQIRKSEFGKTVDGKIVYLYTIEASDTFRAEVMNYGATLRSLFVPDRDKHPVNVALGFETLEGYQTSLSFYGALVGPVANRIQGASFVLNGETFVLEANEHGNCLHSGRSGFDKQYWTATELANGVSFHLDHKDMEHGFPGNISVDVSYIMGDDNTLTIEYKAVSDKDTVLDMTNHSYFNLNGAEKKTVLDHELKLFCHDYLETDEKRIPTGVKLPVKDTPFDFTNGKLIGQDIAADDPALHIGNGYDHYFVGSEEAGLRPLAILKSEASGITMEYSSDKPGLMVYTGNGLKPSAPANTFGIPTCSHLGVAFEAQCYPDSPNHPERTSVILKAGETYHSVTRYRFSAQ